MTAAAHPGTASVPQARSGLSVMDLGITDDDDEPGPDAVPVAEAAVAVLAASPSSLPLHRRLDATPELGCQIGWTVKTLVAYLRKHSTACEDSMVGSYPGDVYRHIVRGVAYAVVQIKPAVADALADAVGGGRIMAHEFDAVRAGVDVTWVPLTRVAVAAGTARTTTDGQPPSHVVLRSLQVLIHAVWLPFQHAPLHHLDPARWVPLLADVQFFRSSGGDPTAQDWVPQAVVVVAAWDGIAEPWAWWHAGYDLAEVRALLSEGDAGQARSLTERAQMMAALGSGHCGPSGRVVA